jgi:acyl carrier protein
MSDVNVIREEVERILREKASVDLAAGDADLVETGVLDSLTFVELVLALERRFGLALDITAIELDHLRSVPKIVEFVAHALGA